MDSARASIFSKCDHCERGDYLTEGRPRLININCLVLVNLGYCYLLNQIDHPKGLRMRVVGREYSVSKYWIKKRNQSVSKSMTRQECCRKN